MNKKHQTWIIKNRIEICTFDGIPSLDFVGKNSLSDLEIYEEWQKKITEKEIKAINNPYKFVDVVNDFIRYLNKKNKENNPTLNPEEVYSNGNKLEPKEI